MIARLTGRLYSKTTQSVIIDASGVGYEVLVPLSTFYALPEENEPVSLHTYTHVREDALQLFGFQTRLEKDIFLMLISVAGIGPKLAANVLSGIGPRDLLAAMAGGDAARLQAIPGVGRKTAERIALELRERAQLLSGKQDAAALQWPPGPRDETLLKDALSALVNLGYTRKAAEKALARAHSALDEVNLEDLIRKALGLLA